MPLIQYKYSWLLKAAIHVTITNEFTLNQYGQRNHIYSVADSLVMMT